ncbi:SixA phosphatase family protein [Methylocella tundrae]|uniref:Putative phosphohistidine phosphatase, SixA n=1 Tax=Methylocella tundrae TaxID=227605 RepID=A0A4U8YZH5_METTU|nr:histidine phosphatase family protein [Methylocella tundrae]WPP06072.1 histidine phosphatase family protein [Methylocella tundrae]VFU08673.1 putative phosphohistidine phosphatase, SixA [Methylocella tundrae]
MPRLLLLRHAEAAPSANRRDIDRRLTPGGRSAAVRIGAYLRSAALAPNLVFVSPAQRTLETLQEVERGLGRELSYVTVPALYHASAETIFAVLSEAPSSIDTLLMIGHNPGFAEAANVLSKAGNKADLARLRAQFPAPCLAVIDLAPIDWSDANHARGRLERFVTLATLEK